MDKKRILEIVAGIVIIALVIAMVSCVACKGGNATDANKETSDEAVAKETSDTAKNDENEKNIENETEESGETSLSNDETTTIDMGGEGDGDMDESTENASDSQGSATENATQENSTKDSTTKDNSASATTATTATSTTSSSLDTKEEETTKTTSGTSTDNGSMSKTTAEVVKDMGIGINLGNTFESCGDWINASSVTNFEKAWGSPVITQEIIAGMAAEGFGVLRIPVAWSNMMDDNYNIDESYINRVKEVTDWAIDSGMYVIVNIHYDGGWWTEFSTNKSECMKKYKAIWTQLAEAFKDYDEKLVLESLNEEGCWDDIWNRYSGSTSGKSTAYGLLNEINQTFVDIIRASGGNNAKRHLLIAGYATDITLTCDSCFKMPSDSAGRCAVSVHYYTPFAYTHLTEDTDWAKVQTEWGSASDINELNYYMKMMYDNFVSKGVPVIIGEFGVAEMSNKDKDNAVYYMSSVAEAAYDYGMCPILWDTTSSYSFYNRYNCCMSEYPTLKEAFLNILK